VVVEALTRSVDIYCERLGPGFWAEPVNAVTNVAFLVAAGFAWQRAAARGRLDLGVGLLIALVAAVGVGSFLFHTVATVWAAIADVLPIQLFIVAYLALALRRLVGLGWTESLLLGIGFVPAAALAARGLRAVFAHSLNGSEAYLPALAALLAVAASLAARGAASWRPLLGAAAVLALSLAFRTADQALCPKWPIGTHFIWHLLNGLLLGILLLAMIRHGRVSGQS
jgi:hypothetical protein